MQDDKTFLHQWKNTRKKEPSTEDKDVRLQDLKHKSVGQSENAQLCSVIG